MRNICWRDRRKKAALRATTNNDTGVVQWQKNFFDRHEKEGSPHPEKKVY